MHEPEILESLAAQVDPAHTALLVVDAQNDFVHPRGAAAQRRGVDVSHLVAAVPALNHLIRHARHAAVRVLYIRVVHSPETTYANKRLFRRTPQDLWPAEGTWGADWYEELEKPAPGDIVLTKYNYDSFRDTPLNLYLGAMGIRTVVVAGFITEVCVETTARRAFVEGYYVVVPRDCTASYDEDHHRASLRVLDRYFAKVVDSRDVMAVWERVGQAR